MQLTASTKCQHTSCVKGEVVVVVDHWALTTVWLTVNGYKNTFHKRVYSKVKIIYEQVYRNF